MGRAPASSHDNSTLSSWSEAKNLFSSPLVRRSFASLKMTVHF